jgi:UDP-N-acetylmuramate--alanine ligase
MRIFPNNFGTLHFTGIGGIGMSGLAELLHQSGYIIQGSDNSDSSNLPRLREQGIRILAGNVPENVIDKDGNPVSGLVYSAGVAQDNPELVQARALKIPLIQRSELLAEVMRVRWSIGVTGTHGKTTTTSLVGALLEAGGIDPTVVNGGIVNAYGTNTRIGKGDWMVVEADEAFGTFLKLRPTIAIVTNMDPEHLDYYHTFENVRAAYKHYVDSTPFYGLNILCLDHPEVQKLAAQIKDRRVVTYGTNPQADVMAQNIRQTADGSIFDIRIGGMLASTIRIIKDVRMPTPGAHNVLNSLAAVAVAIHLGVADDVIKSALSSFSGVKRRFTQVGIVNGVRIIDDYGHHPVEIAAVLKAARSTLDVATKSKIIAVVQPHRYGRVHDLFDDFCTCFNDADTVLVADVYAAGEEPIKGAEKEDIVAGLIQAGHKNAMILRHENDLPQTISHLAKSGDIVVFLGAGNITKWANALPQQLTNKDAA